MEPRNLNRRDFIRVTGLAAGLTVATACAGATPAPAEPTPAPAEPTATPAEATPVPAATEAPVSKYSEAPSLAAKVAAGELPPVEERLPAEPLVVECFDQPGEYCDDLHRCVATASSNGLAMYCWEGLTRWDFRSGNLQIVPNIARSWDTSADGTTYTFYLREGMRWSDGEPFTADDIMFWYEDIALNEELTPSFPGWLTVGGEPVKIERVDDYSVRFVFAKPYAILLEQMSFRGESAPPFAPKHYLSQFHPNYADKAELDRLTAEAKFETWYQLFANRNDWRANPDLPLLWPWKPDTGWEQIRTVASRNPYYFKVDTNGKQLPYFERLVVDTAENSELILMKAMGGEIDLQASHMQFVDYPLLKEHEESGGYRVLEWLYTTAPCVNVNQSTTDLEQRKMFQTTEFRHALSYAINRDELNELFWHGLALPTNVTPCRFDAYYQEGWGTTALEFDLDKANALLDEMGLDKCDAEGFRLRPDGKRLQLLLENYPTFEVGTAASDLFAQVASYWRVLGIDALSKEVESSLWVERAMGNQSDLPSYCADTLLWVCDPGWFVPYGFCYWAPAFAAWQSTGGSGGEEPPAEIKQLIEWYDQLKAEPDADKRLQLGRSIGQQHHEQLYMIGLCTPEIAPMVAKKDLVNVLEKGLSLWTVHRDMLTWPFQVWRRQA